MNNVLDILKSLTIACGLLSQALAATPSATYTVLPPPQTFNTQADIRNYIAQEASYMGIPTSQALFVAEHESRFNPLAVGDLDKTCKDGSQMRSRGMWQIQNCSHPEVTDECAFSVSCSTAWALPYMKDHPNEWSSWLMKDKWYAEKL